MTLAQVKATGSGRLGFRLSMEGLPYEAVTDKSMERTSSDARILYTGLLAKNFRISERASLADAILEIEGNTLEIVDIAERWTKAFAYKPTIVGMLTGDVNASVTSLPVNDIAAFSVDTVYHLGTEAIRVNTKAGSALNSVVRHYWDTQPQAHFGAVSATGTGERAVYLTDWPMALERRRMRIYAYGEGDDPQGPGTLIWRGITGARPKPARPTAWSVQIKPVTSLLDQKIAADANRPVRLRGIYHPWTAPFYFSASERSGADRSGSFSFTTTPILITGFDATEDAFVSRLQLQIDTACAAFATYTNGGSINVQIVDGELHFTIRYGSVARYVEVTANSPIDGYFSTVPQTERSVTGGSTAPSVSASSLYHYSRLGPLVAPGAAVVVGVPRAWLGLMPSASSGPYTDPSASATAPHNRLHLQESPGVAVGDGVSVLLPPAAGTDEDASFENFEVVALNATDRWIEISPSWGGWALDAGTEINAARSYGRNTDLQGFRAALVLASVNANRGGTPLITDDDLADWSGEIALAVAGRRFAAARDYIFRKPATLRDILAEELKLIGCYLYVDAVGKIAVRRLHAAAPTEPTVIAITDSHNLRRVGWPEWDTNIDGVINLVRILTGYDQEEDDYAIEHLVPHDRSISEHGGQKSRLEISPRSSEVDDAITAEEAADVAQVALGMFADDYEIIKINVPLNKFDALIGDTVSLTLSTVPDSRTGTRGITGLAGIVIAREWVFMETHGALTVLVHRANIAGYSPSCEVRASGTSDLGSNLWLIETTGTKYAPTGVKDASYFEVGDIVEIVQKDSFTPSTQTGTVTARNLTPGNPTLTIQLDGAAPGGFPGTGTWYVAFRDNATGYTPTAAQKKYCYDADATQILYDGATARVFAP